MPTPDTTFPKSATMFYCIGAQKAGTTWLFDTLSRSNQVHFCKNKELHYFDVASGRDSGSMNSRITAVQRLAGRLVNETGPKNLNFLGRIADLADLLKIYSGELGDHNPYLEYLLRDYAGQPVVADITPAYAMLKEETFADMATIGDAKFLFIMRDPVDRMWSHIRMTLLVEGHDDGINFEDACAERADILIDSGRLQAIERGNYKLTMTRLEASVPRDRIKYVFFEDLFAPETMNGICDFLGIDPITANGGKNSNTGRSAKMPERLRLAFEQAFAPQYAFVRAHLGDAVPNSWGS